ncbi:sensor domain-containing diguanylate cyclase [Undibacterium curvum]|uniref:Diguanylate cyclase n=1 Tax=Undibacterium curvum TaxID=2762294 RepID=A0ABR6ZZZ9_9BURK|nr:sensor domain-containing diguanylate cyclase [Undibacterium curvum]MBC3930245.1 diguanylate cyclase [Undibacterium curvum]
MRELFRTSIVFRSTSIVLGITLLIGGLFSTVSYLYFLRAEQKQAVQIMHDLLNSVENTAQIACYLSDANLAKELVQGLSKNHDIRQIVIYQKEHVLASFRRDPDGNPSPIDKILSATANTNGIQRNIHSPFNATEQVCTVAMETDQLAIRAQSSEKASFIAYLLLLQAIAIALIVAALILVLITRPIMSISSRLHRLRPEKGELLQSLSYHGSDELGTLVSDVNQLIGNLVNTLDEERRLRIQHALGERKYQTLFDNAETGIFQINPEGLLLSCNQALLRMLGISSIAENDAMLLQALEGQELRLHLMIDQTTQTAQPASEDFLIETGQGLRQKKWIHLVIHSAENGVLQGLMNDITERKLSEEQANRLAVTDHLTNIHNRLGFEREMSRLAKENARHAGCDFFLLLIDLDKFKEVNDSYGHAAGDKVLMHFSAILSATLRKTDFIARLGGDEFVVLLRGVSELETAQRIADKIIQLTQQPISISDNEQVIIGASIGISFTRNQEFAPASLIERADEALYTVKKSGRNSHHFSPS